jgi:glycosyltransferase involved in cell wall biosynthesis
MGKVAPIGDAPALAAAIIEVVQNHARYVKPRDEVAAMYSTEKSVSQYEALYNELLAEKKHD